MKKLLAVLLTLAFTLSFPSLQSFSADKTLTQTTNAAISTKAAEIEKKYGIHISYPQRGGQPIITMNSLLTLDAALENVTPGVVRQISEYYRKLNGSPLNFSYVQSSPRLTDGNASILAGFDNNTSLIELYIPTSAGSTIATGENPISIVHELGHAFHLMYADRYGYREMEQEWAAFNSTVQYQERNIMNNPSEKLFVSGYAATSFAEDVAETFAHAFVRNQPGQGFSGKLNSGDQRTGLGRKVAYLEKMLSILKDTDQAVANFRQVYTTKSSITYQGMQFSGDYLQYAGYPQPRYVLSGTLTSLGKEKQDAIWLRTLGGWYVKEANGQEIIVFPGGVWCKVSADFQAPKLPE